MSTDARISVGLPAHPKTKKLIKRHGREAAWNLVCLFLWTASNRPDGSLQGLSSEDIELAADWCGEDGAFVQALLDVRFLDGVEGDFVLHDWAEHNPWAAGSDMRSAKAKWNAAKRHHGVAEADRLVPEYAAIRSASSSASSSAEVDASSNKTASSEQTHSNAPSPSPSPSPSLEEANASVASKLPTCQTDAVVNAYHENLPELPAVRLLNDSRRKAISAFWRWVLTSKKSNGDPRATNAQEALDWIVAYFRRASENDFLMGRHGSNGKHAQWKADFDFLLTEKGKRHVIEKTEVAA